MVDIAGYVHVCIQDVSGLYCHLDMTGLVTWLGVWMNHVYFVRV